MRTVKVGAMVIALTVIVALVMRWQQATKHLQAEAATLREQAAAAESLREENQHLREQLKAATEASQASSPELLRLRAQAGTTRELRQENARLKSERGRLTKREADEQADGDSFDRAFGPGAHARNRLTMRWGTALRTYALQHQGQFPASFQDAAPFLQEDLSAEDKAQTIAMADQYEILYHGGIEDMTNPPPESTIIMREKDPWLTSQGTWARNYFLGNGSGTLHTEPDGHFENWEALRAQKPSNPMRSIQTANDGTAQPAPAGSPP